jgi:diguanylate cyclase (GGDEF)-like protein
MPQNASHPGKAASARSPLPEGTESADARPATIEACRARIAELEREKQDLEIAYATAIEHGDATESELAHAIRRLHDEVKERMLAESRLERLVKTIRRQNEDLEQLVRTVAEHSDEIDATWIARYAEAEALSRIDALTRLANRRAFDTALEDEWRRRQRAGEPLSLAMCDIDFFKLFNDHYGHAKGDHCLAAIGSILRQSCRRPGDMAARYGGEEFVLLLPGTTGEAALEIARETLELLRIAAMPHAQSPHGIVTMSMGLATVVPSADIGPWDLVAMADRQLYAAKREGRNTVCAHRGDSV